MPVTATNRWTNTAYGSTSPGRRIWAATKSDTDEQPYVFRRVRANVAGTIRLVPVEGDASVDFTLATGESIDGFFRAILSTGTTATGLVCFE